MVSIETVEQLIACSRPKGRLLQGSTMTLLGLSMLLGALAADPGLVSSSGPLSWLLPQLVVLCIVVLVMQSARRQRRLAGYLQEALEAVQLREWWRARALLERLLRYPLRYPSSRAESLLALASVAEAGQAYDASQRIYESLLEEGRADPLQLHTARVALAAAMLRTGQVTDAIGMIDRLAREDLPEPLRVQIELLSLFREVTMGQAAEHLDRAAERRAMFCKYLGTRAGFGLALLAVAFDGSGRVEAAGRHWHDATLLVAPAELLARFRELTPLAAKYPAASLPLSIRSTASMAQETTR